jgi:hypothetical protein
LSPLLMSLTMLAPLLLLLLLLPRRRLREARCLSSRNKCTLGGKQAQMMPTLGSMIDHLIGGTMFPIHSHSASGSGQHS